MKAETEVFASEHQVVPSLVERRSFPRARLVTELGLYSDSNFYTGFTEDISEGGVFVATYAVTPVGSQVVLELALPGDFEIHTTGTVRWIRGSGEDCDGTEPPGMGIQFDALTEEELALIREFVENRSPLFFDAPGE